MKLPRRQFLHLAAGAAALPVVSRIARAQAYPSRPITMIVPFAPGGLTDVICRILAEGMRTSLGQPVIIENVGGANGSIGTGRVARAAPDGYTLVVGIWNTHVANAAIYALQYDVVKDFEPVLLLADAPLLLVASKAVPANDLKEFIAWLNHQWELWALAAQAISSAFYCKRKQAHDLGWWPIAAPAWRCKTLWRGRSRRRLLTLRPHCRMCAPAAQKPLPSRPKDVWR